MKMSITNRFRLSLVGILCMVVFPGKSQQNNSMYYMQGLPQSNQLNPATQPKCGFFLGLPSIEVNAGNSAVGFNDVLIYKPSLDAMVWFLHDESTRSNFLSKFKNDNSLFGEVRLDLLSLGFRIRNSYLTLSVGERVESRNNIPYDFARFVVEANLDSIGGVKKSFDFSGFGVNATYYHEYALGFSHEYNGKLTIGIKGKLLFGIANITTNSSSILLENGGVDSYKTRSVIDLNTSIPHLKVVEKKDGTVDSLKFTDIENDNEARNILLNRNNMGMALDLGMVYKPMDKLSFSVSILDLGYIHWKDNLHNFKQDATYDFRGMYFTLNDSVDMADALLDTLKNKFTYNSVANPYNTWLSPKFYAGVLFKPVKLIGLGFLTRQQIIEKNLHSQYTFSLNLYPANAFNLTLSYTIADKMYDNFGFGLAWKLGPFQMYLMSERIPLYWDKNKGSSSAYIPAYAKNFNLRTGLNFVFGYKHREKKAKRDRPLVDL